MQACRAAAAGIEFHNAAAAAPLWVWDRAPTIVLPGWLLRPLLRARVPGAARHRLRRARDVVLDEKEADVSAAGVGAAGGPAGSAGWPITCIAEQRLCCAV